MLPEEQRLRDNRDFRRVYARGRSYANGLAVLYVLRRDAADTPAVPGRRIGFVVSKKQGGAVVRNRIKRRLREAVRLRLPALREGPLDIIFVARGRLKEASWPEVQAAVDDLLRRGRLLRADTPTAMAEAPPTHAGAEASSSAHTKGETQE
ncbi:MAG TPA: ribonuclease P protein component [Chthonomonadaceae bacterium]|nr:ribonuclease P protein component [Chthonomonadaceae bacterium]